MRPGAFGPHGGKRRKKAASAKDIASRTRARAKSRTSATSAADAAAKRWSQQSGAPRAANNHMTFARIRPPVLGREHRVERTRHRHSPHLILIRNKPA